MSSTAAASLRRVVPILIGSAIYAFGLHYFVIPNELMEGGVTGVAILLNYIWDLPLSATTLVLNIPLFLLGWKFLGRKAMVYTITGTVSLSFFLWVMELLIRSGWIVPFRTEQDYFLAVLYAGVTLGAGLGIVFRFGGTTGGGDIIARLGHKMKGWSMGQVILVMDTAVIGTSLLYIPKEKVLYTLVAVFIAARIIDFIQEGAYAAKAVTVIADQAEAMASAITRELDRGVTLFPAKGAYSGLNKQVIYCVVNRHETRRLIALVRSMDSSAFIVVNEVHEVLGEGFKTEES